MFFCKKYIIKYLTSQYIHAILKKNTHMTIEDIINKTRLAKRSFKDIKIIYTAFGPFLRSVTVDPWSVEIIKESDCVMVGSKSKIIKREKIQQIQFV